MGEFNIIVPNLDRRPDRWYACFGGLFALGFPVEKLTRFSAHDHTEYDSIDTAKAVALKQFPEAPYLRYNVAAKGYFCWSWTWYEIMTQIAMGSNDDDYTLLLVDDYTMRVTYREVREHIVRLSKCDGQRKMIQYAYNDQIPGGQREDGFELDDFVEGTPFRRGLSHSGDVANVFTRVGAQEILTVANKGHCGVPNWVFWYAARSLPPDGYFSARGLTRPLNQSRHINSYEDAREGST